MAIECPKCHSENNEGSRFCSHCAAPLSQAGSPTISLTRTLETPVRVLKPGSLIADKYRIIDEIGRGGMGVVYKAEDVKLKRPVALKFLPPHLMDSPDLKERFLIEAQAAAALSHPNICVIHEVGESGEHPYIAMEYVEGETLRDKIKKGPLKSEEALDISSQIAAGLGQAHAKGIIHRDIKSANIMVTDKGQAKVMDFGLAKLRGGSSLTRTQTTLGTVAYMSPEQARGAKLDERTDIWSLGVVLFEILTGRLPFRGDHDQAMIHSILHAQPESLNKARPDAPASLGAIIGQALAKKPDERYRTMDDLLADLKAVADGLKPKARPRPAGRTILGLRSAYVYTGLAVIILALFGANVGGIRDRLPGRTSGPSRMIKLAVLPFANLSGDPGQEFLSDGLTQQMNVQLAGLNPQNLGVIGNTSVARYKKSNTPIDQIGRELAIDYVLEGGAQREGNRIRITAELIKVKDQTQIWAESFDREFSSALVLQSEVARKVAGALALKLLPAEQARLANARPVNPEAYEAYLKGSQYASMLTKASLDAAFDYFELATKKDPNYALAYAGIAGVWNKRNQMGFAPWAEAIPKSRAAILKALEIDDGLPEAHLYLASSYTYGEFNLKAGDRELDRVDELGGSPADLGHIDMIMGRADEAMAKVKKGLALDPFNPSVLSFYAMVLHCAKRHEEAVAQARKALAIQPDAPVALSALYLSLVQLKRFDEVHELDKKLLADFPEFLDELVKAYAKEGYVKAWGDLADKHAALHDKGQDAIDIADSYVLRGDKAKALDWLEKAYEEHNPGLPYISCFPRCDPLRSEPRFQALLRRMGIPATENR